MLLEEVPILKFAALHRHANIPGQQPRESDTDPIFIKVLMAAAIATKVRRVVAQELSSKLLGVADLSAT